MLPAVCTFTASIITVACCASLFAVVKSLLRFDCLAENVGASGSNVRPTITALLIAAVLAFGATVVFLFKPLPNRAGGVAGAMCSKWQPLYFIVVSVQRIVLRVIAIAHAGSNKRGVSCGLSANDEYQYHAATTIWDCAIFMMGAATMCCDLHADFTPTMKRCAQCALALCMIVDAIGSYIWGNHITDTVSVSVSGFEFLMDNMITSCITSQAVLALHFAHVACRSREGRGWDYAPLRFELDQHGRASLSSLNERCMTESSITLTLERQAASEEVQSKAAARWSCAACSRLHKRFLRLQKQREACCRVFVVPCVARCGDGSRGDGEFELARPAFNLRCLRPLQRVAQAHPKFYFIFMFSILSLPAIALSRFLNAQSRGISCFVLNCAMVVATLGFISSKRYNLDRVAVKQVVLSFRFGVFVVLLAQWIMLDTRRAYLVIHKMNESNHGYDTTPWDVAAIVNLMGLFFTSVILDCSPHLPAIVQILLTVSAQNAAESQIPVLKLPAGWMVDDIWILELS
jgi:hypothetical protein